jgi:hypothetical protein
MCVVVCVSVCVYICVCVCVCVFMASIIKSQPHSRVQCSPYEGIC